MFDFLGQTQRSKVLPICAFHMMMEHHLDVYINEDKFEKFVNLIYSKYRRSVQYHNDLHGTDVA